MINRIILIGRMTRDPELKRITSGAAVTSFTLAVNRSFKSDNGPEADFINCQVWNKIAENVEKYCSKGSLVAVEGRLQTRTYDNDQGQKVFMSEVICNSVQFIGTKSNENQVNQGAVKEEINKYEQRTNDVLDQVQNINESNNIVDNQYPHSFDIMDEDIQF